jgi:hypothetical protein
MARRIHHRDIGPVLHAAERWIDSCLIEDGSILSDNKLWTQELVREVREAFVDHPDMGQDDFMTKLEGQMSKASPSAQRLMAEMLWALLLFPSNILPSTKRFNVQKVWALNGLKTSELHPALTDGVLTGIGSGGTGFNNYRPGELQFLIELAGDLKSRDPAERRQILKSYDEFYKWIEKVRQIGRRQFRHMLRYFAFPDKVERMSSNRDRIKILESFNIVPSREAKKWSDKKLDEELFALRTKLQQTLNQDVLDFYEPPLRERWARDRTIRTASGEVTVVVPKDEDDSEAGTEENKAAGYRQSLHVQAKLVEIGSLMGFRVWLPRSDRSRIKEILRDKENPALLEDLPLNYDITTLDTIEQIDVLWLKGRSMVRAFEVEHTTAVYSGLLRMADLLALQPNMDIRLHIVAPEERKEKVFREMLRPVFSLLDRGPLSKSCTFLSYESVSRMRGLEHLAHTNDSILSAYEERPKEEDLV